MDNPSECRTDVPFTLADIRAEYMTATMVDEVEQSILGQPGNAAISCLTLIATAQVLMHRYGIHQDVVANVYETTWGPAVDRLTRS